jgi:hypothetical protein
VRSKNNNEKILVHSLARVGVSRLPDEFLRHQPAANVDTRPRFHERDGEHGPAL